MNKKRLAGLFFLVLSIGIVAFNMNLTGAVIGTTASNSFSLVALILFIGGIFILSSSREKESGLVDIVNETSDNNVKVMISKKAIERSAKDKNVRGNVKKYANIIRMIAATPLTYQQETIGDFKVSPRGHNPLRVAWHYDRKSDTVFVDDLLYHINKKDYVDKWNRNVAKGLIGKSDYEEMGYSATT